jgi:hypothetical protein
LLHIHYFEDFMAISDTGVVCAGPSEEEINQSGSEIGPPKPNSLALRILRTVPELEEIRDLWNLWCNDPNADMEEYLTSARYRAGFVRPHVMVIYRHGRPDCVLVGRLECSRLKLKVGYTTLFEPKIRRLFFLQGGFFGNTTPENSLFLAQGLRQCLQRGEAEHVEFARLTKDSHLYKAAESEFGFVQRGHFTLLHEHRWLELPENFEEFLKGLPRKNRHELRRHDRKFSEDFAGRTHIRCYRLEEEVDELAQEVEKVAAKTYQRALGVGFRPDPEIVELLRTTARQGGLRGCVLYVDDQPCAFFIGKQYRTIFHGYFMGFDPQYGKYSPGLLVLMHCIEECFDPHMRATQFDLGWGDRQYKRVICNQSKQDGPLYLYRLSAPGLRLNLLRSLTSFLDVTAREMLAKSSFIRKLKRAWQKSLQSPPSDASSPAQKCFE